MTESDSSSRIGSELIENSEETPFTAEPNDDVSLPPEVVEI